MDEVQKEPVLQIHPHLLGVGGVGDVHVPRDRVRATKPAPKLPADGGGVEDQGDRGDLELKEKLVLLFFAPF